MKGLLYWLTWLLLGEILNKISQILCFSGFLISPSLDFWHFFFKWMWFASERSWICRSWLRCMNHWRWRKGLLTMVHEPLTLEKRSTLRMLGMTMVQVFSFKNLWAIPRVKITLSLLLFSCIPPDMSFQEASSKGVFAKTIYDMFAEHSVLDSSQKMLWS